MHDDYIIISKSTRDNIIDSRKTAINNSLPSITAPCNSSITASSNSSIRTTALNQTVSTNNSSIVNDSNYTKVALINIRSVKNKVIELCESIRSKSIDICCITETWVTESDSVTYSQFRDKGFKFINQPRTGKKGGGIGFLSHLTSNSQYLKSQKFETFEVLLTKNSNYLYCTVYRTGNLSTEEKSIFLTEIELLLMDLETKKEIVMICGDFNIHINEHNNKLAKDFLDIIESFGFHQLVKDPTHIANATLDLIFVNDLTNVMGITVYNQSMDVILSDHYMVEILLKNNMEHVKEKQYSYRKVSCFNVDNFSEDLNLHLQQLVTSNSRHELNSETEILFEAIASALDLHAPIVTKTKIITAKPFTNEAIRNAKRKKRQAERKFKKTRSASDKQALKNTIKTFVNTVRDSENKFYATKLNSVKGDTKSTYQVINHLMNKNQEKHLPEHTDKKNLAEKFANFFKDKIINIRNCITSSTIDQPDSFEINTTTIPSPILLFESFEPVTKEILESIMNNTNEKYSSVDDIPKVAMKCIKVTAFEKIIAVINSSLACGVFPDYLKLGHIIPIIKDLKGDINALKNYRPISNLSFLSKLLEKCALLQLLFYLNQNNLLYKHQSAYRINHSCETALIKIYDDVLSMLEPSTCIVMVFLDFSAAFDTIDHKILLQKLKTQFFVEKTALKWFESFLTGRKSQVNIENCLSSFVDVKYGVPQGSVMGPVLFSLYVQELHKIVERYNFNMHIFADDVQIYFKCDINNINLLKLKNCMDEIKYWANINFLKLNDTKTKFLILSNKSPNPGVFSNVFSNFSVDVNAKNLGFILDSKLSFNAQINHVCQCGYYLLRNLWRISAKLNDVSLRIQIVQSCILSHIDYCNSLFYDLPNESIKKLQRLMNASIRFIYKIRLSDTYSITSYMKQCHFLPVKARIDFKINMLVYKCINGTAPIYLQELIQPKNSLACLRIYHDNLLLQTPSLNLNNKKNRSFSLVAPREWNKLPFDIRSSSSLPIFKSKLKTYLFSQCFGS